MRPWLHGYISSAPAALSDVATWSEQPFWYEMGQKTVPNSVYELVKDLPVLDRGRAIFDMMGLRSLLPSSGPWGATLAQGPTPGGLLALFGLSAGSYAGGSDCGCH